MTGWVAGLVTLAAVTGCGGAAPSASAPSGAASGNGQINLLETGSTLLYPLFNIWVPVYTKDHPNVRITTQGTGSGTGIADAIKGLAQIGASDAYLAPAQAQQTPGLMNIPLAISAQQIDYNLPGLNNQHLKLSGPVLAGMYTGSIKYWDAAQIAQLNPGVQLPHQQIIPVHRTDGSGDTFIFTQYLSDTTPSWKSGPGFGTTVSWPSNPLGVGANGNPGMVQAIQQAPYSVAYIGVSWLNQVKKAGLGEAQIENADGKFLLPTPQTIKAAAAAMTAKTPADETISLIYAPGADAYPIINYEYAIVNAKQPAGVGAAVKAFLTWAVSPTGGNSPQYLDQVHFVALPPSIVALSQAQIAKIGG